MHEFTQNGEVAASGRLTDQISLGILASLVPRDAVDDTVAEVAAGTAADGRLPPHVVVYLEMAPALFAGEDYEEVAAQLGRDAGGLLVLDAFRQVPTACSAGSRGSPTSARSSIEARSGGSVPGATQSAIVVGRFTGARRSAVVYQIRSEGKK